MVVCSSQGESREAGKNNVGGVMTEDFLEEESFQQGVEKQLRCGEQKGRLDIAEG